MRRFMRRVYSLVLRSKDARMLPAALITAVACKTLILNELSFRNPAFQR